MKFVDGRELTSDDVVKSIAYFIDPAVPAQWAKWNQLITGARAVDKYTVAIDLSAPDANLPVTLVVFQVIDMSSLSTINQHPNGTGPYTVKEFVPNDHVVLVPNPNYWGPKPKLDEINIVKTADPTAAVTALKTGSIQALWGPPLTAVAGVGSSADIKIVHAVLPGKVHEIELDTSTFPFNDVRARQALSYATDRETILKTAYFGNGLLSPANVYTASNNVAYNKALPHYDFNLAKAKQLFDAVGVKDLTWWTIAGAYPEWVTEGQIYQSNLAQIGITMDIQTNEISTWAEKFYPAHKEYPGLLVPNALPLVGPPAFDFNFLYGGLNSMNWQDAEFDQAYVAAQSAADASAQASYYNRLQEIQNVQVPTVVGFHISIPVLTRANVSGLWVSPDGTVHLETADIS